MMPSQPGPIQVTDRLVRRIRKPIDLLRCTTSFIEIIVLVAAGVAASATTTGLETDITGARGHLSGALLAVAPSLALFAILIIPVALAVRQLVRRQVQRLAEAVATGVLAGVVAAVANAALRRAFAERLYDAIIMSRPGTSHVAALDPYLAGLVAYATIIGLSGRPGWRNALWLAIGVYALVHLAALNTTLLSFLITMLAGRTIGLGVRYVAGSPSLRPSAAEIAAALNSPDRKLIEMCRLGNGAKTPNQASRHYAAATSAGERQDITVYDKDQQAAGAVYRVYRAVLLRAQVSRGAPLSADRTVERRALLSYAAEEAGAPTPRLRAVVRVGPEAIVLAYYHHQGTTLAEQKGCTDAELRNLR
ncbi:MAG: hypothetical protein ACRDPD_12390, partial [Streptosporangiaceae bacterium]